MPKTYLFGYGSLLEHFQNHTPKDLQPANLHGFSRKWNVAMNNAIDIPGYRYFLTTKTELRPNVYVTFLNIEPSPDGSVNGVLIPVSISELVAIDQREQNYNRIDVTSSLSPPPDQALVYAYVGKPAARLRFERGLADGKAVISQTYLDKVEAGFLTISDDSLTSFQSSTDQPNLPVST